MLGPTNPWDSDPIVQPAPGFTGVIPGAPAKPKEPSIPVGYEPDPARPGHLQPIAGGPEDPATNDTLDDKTTTFYAQQVLSGAPMPAMGMGKTASQNRQKVMGKVAELAGAQGMTGASLATQITHYKAQSANIQNLEKQLGTVEQSEATALQNGQQFLDRSTELPGQTEYPLLNSLTQTVQRNVPVPGHDTIAAMDAAYNTFVNEYAKVVSGSPNGSGTLSDAARREAMDTIRSNAAVTQKQAAFAQMKADMANRIAASHKIIQESYDNLTKKPGYEIPASLNLLNASGPGASGNDNNGGAPPPPPLTNGGGGGDGTTPPGVSDMTQEQKQSYAAFLKANPRPSGDQIGGFLSKLLGKQVTNGDAIAKSIANGAAAGTTIEDNSYAQKVNDRLALEDKLQGRDSSLKTVINHGATLGLSDEAAGVGGALGSIITSPLTGKFDPVGAYRLERDVERQRIAQADKDLGYAAPFVEFGGSMLSANPSGALAAMAPRQVAKAGAAGGALAGFGHGEGASESMTGAGVGAVAGALTPLVAGKVVSKVVGLRAPRGLAPEVADAAQAENVDLLRPMIDPTSRGKFGALESAPGSQGVIRAGVDRTSNQIEDRVAALGQGGNALETDAAGERIQGAARTFIQRSKGVADRLYNRARNLAGDTRFVPQKAIDEAEAQAAELRANPETNAGELNFLEGLHSDLAKPGGKTVDELRSLRQSLRGRINEQGLTATRADARATAVLDAAQQDAAANMPRGAADAYRRADSFYRERMVHVDDILDRFLGGNVQQGQARLSGEQAFQRLKNMASPGGDSRRLAGMMRDLDPNERQDVSATIAASLGRRAADQPFSTDLFLSQTNKLSPAARRTIFGADGAQSIDNLRTLSQALKEGVGDFNRSKTANSMWRQMAGNFVGSLTGLGGAAGLAEGGLAGGGKGALAGIAVGAAVKGTQAGIRTLSARAMVNPRVSMWLAQAAKVSSPSQAQQAVKGLSLVISREPALANELTPIRDFLDQRVAQLLAADPASGDQNQQQGR